MKAAVIYEGLPNDAVGVSDMTKMYSEIHGSTLSQFQILHAAGTERSRSIQDDKAGSL
jgi:hypothetical protein